MAGFQARGDVGELKAGYHVVARLTNWTLDGNGRIDAAAFDVNEFRLDMGGPFSVRLKFGKRYWVWADAEVHTMDPCTIRVNGSPDVRD